MSKHKSREWLAHLATGVSTSLAVAYGSMAQAVGGWTLTACALTGVVLTCLGWAWHSTLKDRE